MCAKRCNASDVSGGGGRVSSAQATILPYTLKRGFLCVQSAVTLPT